jgi:hypothetical protein
VWLFFLVLAAGLPLAAQQSFNLGTSSDTNCSGGLPYSIPGSAAVRYGWISSTTWPAGDIVCSFPVPAGIYQVQMQFLEPCYAAGCSILVTQPGGRKMSVYAGGAPPDQPLLYGFDPVAAGATDKLPATRTVILQTTGPLVLTFKTVIRGAVVSGVTITPVGSADPAGCLRLGAITLTLQPGTSGAIVVAPRNSNVDLHLDRLASFADLAAYLSISAGGETFDIPPPCGLSLAVNDTGACLNFTINGTQAGQTFRVLDGKVSPWQ